jgi:hypothetical protein
MVVLVAVVGGMPGPLSLLLPLLAIVAAPIAFLLLVGGACVFFWRQRLRKGLSALLAAAVPVLLVVPIGLLQPYVHLALMLALGIGYIGPTPDAGQRVAIYDWSTGFAGGPSTFLIHDTTDAIASPETRDISAWRNDEFLKDCAATARHLIGHYYVCDI